MTVFTPGGAEGLGFFIPLTKIDEEKRMIYGIGAQGDIVDKSREIMDYPTGRPQFEAWSKDCAERSGGLSKGNVRAMHDPKTSSGVVKEMDFDDDKQLVKLGVYVTDDNDWRKCLAGNFTGFSMGGGYLKKWKDPATGHTRYTPIIREMSLVDNPCIPTARFAELVKADGAVEQIALTGVVHSFADLWGSRPIGFAEAWAGRPAPVQPPKTFGELYKTFDETKHNRDHGRFSAGPKETKEGRSGYLGGALTGWNAGSLAAFAAPAAGAKLGGAVQAAKSAIRRRYANPGTALSTGMASDAFLHTAARVAGRITGQKIARRLPIVGLLGLGLYGGIRGAAAGRAQDEADAAAKDAKKAKRMASASGALGKSDSAQMTKMMALARRHGG